MNLSIEQKISKTLSLLSSSDIKARLDAAYEISWFADNCFNKPVLLSSEILYKTAQALINNCVEEINDTVRYANLDALSGIVPLCLSQGVSLDLQYLVDNIEKFSAREKEPLALSLGYTKNPSYKETLNQLLQEKNDDLHEIVLQALQELEFRQNR